MRKVVRSLVKFRVYLLLILFTLTILLPPLIYGYTYPTPGDDTADHLAVMDSISRGEAVDFRYLGLAIVGYPISTLSTWTGISTDNLFLWFNFLTLVGIGFTFYLILSRLVNRTAGLLALPIIIFCTPSFLTIFQCGTIFHLINTCIILPWGIYFMIKCLQKFRIYQALLAVSFFSLFSVFHPTAVYLPPALGLLLTIILGHRIIVRKKKAESIIILTVGTVVIGLSIVLLKLFPLFQGLVTSAIDRASGILAGVEVDSSMGIPTISNFLAYYLGLITLTLLILITMALVIYYKNIKLNPGTKLFLGFFIGLAVILAIVSFTGISYDLRTTLDLAIVLAVVAACLGGIALTSIKRSILTFTLPLVISLGVILTLVSWFSYSSAIRPIDSQAIEYLNNQEGSTYSCSTQVAPWIYSRFLDKDYTERGGDYIIYRSKPMTPRTNPEQFWFQYKDQGESKLEDYENLELLRIFEDKEVDIYVYKNSN